MAYRSEFGERQISPRHGAGRARSFCHDTIDIRQKAKGWLTELSQRTGQTTYIGIQNGRARSEYPAKTGF